MTGLNEAQLAALREALGKANPGFSARELDHAVLAVRRQHEDPEDHDRSLIAERLSWSPEERLRALQSFLALVETARAVSRP